MESDSRWEEDLKTLNSRLDDYDAERHSDESRTESVLILLLRDTCALVRRAEDADQTDVSDLVEKAHEVLNRGINIAYSTDEAFDFLPSFAHSGGTLVQDTMKGPLAFMASDTGFRVSGPWTKESQPHACSTLLSRFRGGVQIPSAETHPLANVVYQARCEITDHETCRPIRLSLSSGGSCLALAASGGYKNRDPSAHYWLLNNDDHELFSVEPELADVAYHIAVDESHKLMFMADNDRIKSYSWENGKGTPVHTLNSNNHQGPLALLPNGRILRAGKGSALSWTIDPLETHGQNYKRIGKGKYKGFEDTGRDVERDDMEFSTGSKPDSTISFADASFKPSVWHRHEPTGYMLSGEEPRVRDSYSCIALDLEHGGKMVTRYLGHGGKVENITTSEGDGNVFLTSGSDGFARLYDIRHPLPALTFDIECESAPCYTAVLAHLDGIPAIFSGGVKTEAIKFWDIRAKQLVYELSTGNNVVNSLVWNSRNSTLYAATECENMDRLGYHHDYRRAKPPRQPREDKMDEDGDEVEDDEDDYDEDEDDDWDDEDRCWPSRAFHMENYFGEMFDAGEDRLLMLHGDEEQSHKLLAPTPEYLASVKVFPLIPNIKKDAIPDINIPCVDTALSWDQLTAADVNFAIVRPLVLKYAGLGNMAVVYACFVVRSHFISEAEENLAYSGVLLSRAALCEILAMKLLGSFASTQIQLAAVLTASWNPLSGASVEVVNEVREAVGGDENADDPQCALEMAIATEAKRFISLPLVQAVVNDIHAGRLVFSMTSHKSVLADNYKPRAIEYYNVHDNPFLDHYRLRVPRYGAILEFLSFVILLLLFLMALSTQDVNKITTIEIAFIVFATAFALDEYTASKEHGWEIYIANIWNVFDTAFIIICAAYLGLRIKGLAYNDRT
ncbi:hypothetical protein PHLCEN_2v3980 [Hermanssonia centrifuga]|uniref:Uncharacterized protein n=1 Tax=Hermanssonia centrifuga TaxID=98765 RepID=A0A2R6Q7I1_9APHY|nr:hypothetical protein PHLCEN_2v3980 [Hermanssonia centrifuga]